MFIGPREPIFSTPEYPSTGFTKTLSVENSLSIFKVFAASFLPRLDTVNT